MPCGLEKGTVGSNPNQHIPSSFKCAHPLGVVLWRYGGLCAPTTLVDGLRILGRTAENHPTVVTDRAPYRLGFTGDLQILTPLCRTRAQWVSCDVALTCTARARIFLVLKLVKHITARMVKYQEGHVIWLYLDVTVPWMTAYTRYKVGMSL